MYPLNTITVSIAPRRLRRNAPGYRVRSLTDAEVIRTVYRRLREVNQLSADRARDIVVDLLTIRPQFISKEGK